MIGLLCFVLAVLASPFRSKFATGLILDGRRAVGLRYRQHGVMHEVRAAREVILSAGALQSPQLLQLSGIGPGELLRRHGIDVVHDLPGVGQNLQDHLQFRLMYRVWRARQNAGLNAFITIDGLA